MTKKRADARNRRISPITAMQGRSGCTIVAGPGAGNATEIRAGAAEAVKPGYRVKIKSYRGVITNLQ
ncbi:MAG: hypothetical protein WC379_15635 [Methanoregula sp.]